MLRALLAMLMMLTALVPPGICQCRLHALVLAAGAHDHEQEEGPDHCPSLPEGHDHEEHDSDCKCPQLLPDCLFSQTCPMVHPDHLALDAALDLPATQPRVPLVGFLDGGPISPVSLQPLFLTLRALLL